MTDKLKFKDLFTQPPWNEKVQKKYGKSNKETFTVYALVSPLN